MNTNSLKKLKKRMYFMFPFGFIFLAAMLMLPAGSLKYWQGWIFCGVVFIPVFFISCYFLKRSPEFLERRMKFKEKEIQQKAIIKVSGILFSIGFLIPGFDYRFGWSSVPIWLVVISDLIILAGYFLVFLSFKENAFAGRTVEIFKGQKVIDTGPYAIVRHPMYAGVVPMFLFMPLALGSFWAMLFFAPICAIIILRILNEEEVLRKGLPGYTAYCKKVRYRLIPFVW
ncbi:methyltransferase family protein [Patescibacteria group bacterium]